MREPSAVQVGEVTGCFALVSRVTPLPSAFITKRSSPLPAGWRV